MLPKAVWVASKTHGFGNHSYQQSEITYQSVHMSRESYVRPLSLTIVCATTGVRSEIAARLKDGISVCVTVDARPRGSCIAATTGSRWGRGSGDVEVPRDFAEGCACLVFSAQSVLRTSSGDNWKTNLLEGWSEQHQPNSNCTRSGMYRCFRDHRRDPWRGSKAKGHG